MDISDVIIIGMMIFTIVGIALGGERDDRN